MKYTREILENACAKANSILNVMRILGIKSQSGSMHKHLNNKIKFYGIDISHFHGQGHNKGKISKKRKNTKDVFILLKNNKREKSHILKRSLLEIGRIYVCSMCNISSWNNKELNLQIDHINGNWQDNRIENLRFLCPNCHSQTETFGSKKRGS